MPSPIPCSAVICESSWKKIHIEKKHLCMQLPRKWNFCFVLWHAKSGKILSDLSKMILSRDNWWYLSRQHHIQTEHINFVVLFLKLSTELENVWKLLVKLPMDQEKCFSQLTVLCLIASSPKISFYSRIWKIGCYKLNITNYRILSLTA